MKSFLQAKILLIRKKKLKKFNYDKLKEECGIFGISNHDDASAMVALGLHALQHRGQEGCGIVSYDGKNYHSEKRQGLVGDHFTDPKVLEKLPGNFAIDKIRFYILTYYRLKLWNQNNSDYCG